jgi:hypothetical protein
MKKKGAKKAPPKSKMHRSAKPTIRIAILVDPYGGGTRTGEEELQDHIDHLKRVFAWRDVHFETLAFMPENLAADLLIFDFGGMSLGNDLLADNSRRVIRWMVDHPSSLVFIASTFTYRHGLKYELEELGFDVSTFDSWEEDSKPPVANMLVGAMTEGIGYGRKREEEMAAWFNEPAPAPPA